MISSIFLAPLPASRYFRFFSFAPNIKVVGRIRLLIGGGGKAAHPLAQLPLVAEGRSCSPCQIIGASLVAHLKWASWPWVCRLAVDGPAVLYVRPSENQVFPMLSMDTPNCLPKTESDSQPGNLLLLSDVSRTLRFFFLNNICLFDCARSQWQHVHLWSLVVACELLIFVACGIQLPDQELNLGSLHRECGVLATGPPGKSWDLPI